MKKAFLPVVVFTLWAATALAEPGPATGEMPEVSEESQAAEFDGGDPSGRETTVGSKVASALEIIAKHPLSPKSLGFQAAQVALDFLGVKYRWGGTSREQGMDCSGFVKAVYALCGIDLPRTSSDQYRQGRPVDRSELTAGDLVFFGFNQRVNHVGIYLGEGKFIHAPRTRETIRIASLEEQSALRRFLGARRLLSDE
jgi:cell wall-associated NlpC family hydrolase